jgi:hypothetical protein
MNLHFLSADDSPATLGLDSAQGGQCLRKTVAKSVAMSDLKKTIGRRDRPDFDRLKQNVVGCRGTLTHETRAAAFSSERMPRNAHTLIMASMTILRLILD